MKYGHGDFICLSSNNTTFIYAFGGCDNPDNSKTIERYDSVMDIWITLGFKIPNSFLNTESLNLSLLNPSDQAYLIFG